MNHAPQHITVLLHEAVDALSLKHDGVYVDCTFGRGGHSRLIAERLSQLSAPGGRSAARLIALDKDPEAVAAAAALGEVIGAMPGAPMFECVHAGFASLDAVLDRCGVEAVDGVLMDLGVSSPQVDVAGRGFSFRRDGPLDMRMDTTQGITAAQWLEQADEQQIREALKNYGEERHAFQIAQAIVARREVEPLRTTGELAALVADLFRTLRRRPEPGQDPATRTFQALRIHVNQELEELQTGLIQAMNRLGAHGRLAVISFHSLEDRIVKQAMRARAQPPEPPKRVPLRAADLPQPGFTLASKAIRPSDAEEARNPRSRSATLRVIEKLTAREVPDADARQWRSVMPRPPKSAGTRPAKKKTKHAPKHTSERAGEHTARHAAARTPLQAAPR